MELPVLSRFNTKHAPLPRRYEETRPVTVQDFTHRRILGLGSEIQQRQAFKALLERDKAIQAAEEVVRIQGERLKEEAVEICQKEAQIEQDKIAKKMTKAMNKKIKEEGLRVEMFMQKLSMEQVMEERAKTEAAVANAVKEALDKAEVEKSLAIARTQTEERNIANINVSKLAETHEKVMFKLRTRLEIKHANELTQVIKQKDEQREEAVARTHKLEQAALAKAVRRMIEQHTNNVKSLKEEVITKSKQIEALNLEIELVNKSRTEIADCLELVKREFKSGLRIMGGFDEDQARVLMPFLYIGRADATF